MPPCNVQDLTVNLINEIANGKGPVPVSWARLVDLNFASISAVVGGLEAMLGPRIEALHESLRIGERGGRIEAEIRRFSLTPEVFTTAQVCELARRVELQRQSDAEFGSRLVNNEAVERLLNQAKEFTASKPIIEISTVNGCSTLPLYGMPIEGLTEVVRALQGSFGPDCQIGLRGGSLEEGLGWLSAGPEGDPRVGESVFTRRTGANIPIYDLSSAARTSSSKAMEDIVADASTYALSGHLAEVTRVLLKEQLRREPLLTEINDYYILNPEIIEANLSRGVLMLFVDTNGHYNPSFHRRHPNWNKGSYRHAAMMESGGRHLRAIVPVPDRGTTMLPGSFAMIVTPQLLGLPQAIQAQLFEAAFIRMDRDEYLRILSGHGGELRLLVS